jgi:diguanylate cyclase (GGDEF)-like protein/PAS domain S-box-containing protein
MASHRDKNHTDNGRHPQQKWDVEAARQEEHSDKEAQLQRLIQELQMYQVELEVQNTQLRQARNESEAACLRAQQGQTVLEQTEVALRDSEEQLYRLADIAVDAIVMLDHEGVVTFCNAACERMFGCAASEVNGSDFHRFVLPERLKQTQKAGFELFSKEGTGPLIGTRTELPARRKDGSEFALELSVSALMLRGAWHAIGIMRDVTERKKLEAEVQDAREYAENIVETVREPLVVLNSELRILTANHSFYDTFQVTPEETIGNFIYDLGNRQWDIPKLRLLFEKILPHDTVLNSYEVEHDFLDVGRKTILLNARQIFRENIGSHIILLAMEDITARKRLEIEIQDAREYAENIVETVREPLVVLNSELRILTANQSFYRTFLVTPEETIGNFIYDLGNRQWDIPKLRVLFEKILPHDTVFNDYEVEHDFLDVGRKVILLNARQIFRKNIGSRVILLAMEDITERKLAEERISEVIGQQQAILDNIPNIAWLKDRDGRYVAVNQPFSSAFQVTPEEMIGKSDRDIYPPELAEKYERDSREVMAAGSRRYFEEAAVDEAGKTRYLEKIETPIFGDKGSVIGIIGIAHDITNRKEVEVTLRHDSTHDMLTGIYNRAFFEAELEHLAQGRRLPVCIVMADVNGLKTVNDTQGHEAGDELIRLAAHVIQRAFRADEVVARIGGDEFAVLLPGASLEVTEEAVERIRRSPEVTGGKLSIAFGVACAEGKDQVGTALKLSDERMYLDKAAQKALIGDNGEG